MDITLLNIQIVVYVPFHLQIVLVFEILPITTTASLFSKAVWISHSKSR